MNVLQEKSLLNNSEPFKEITISSDNCVVDKLDEACDNSEIHSSSNMISHIVPVKAGNLNTFQSSSTVFAPHVSFNKKLTLTNIIRAHSNTGKPVILKVIALPKKSRNTTGMLPNSSVLNKSNKNEHLAEKGINKLSTQSEMSLLHNGNRHMWPNVRKIYIDDENIKTLLKLVDQIFTTSCDGLLITLPCTPGFENEKVSRRKRIPIEYGTSTYFGLTEVCLMEKKFNVMFYYFSSDKLKCLSSQSEIRKCVCHTFYMFMLDISVEDALQIVCNCSLCWFLYMRAKFIKKDSPHIKRTLLWEGCQLSSYSNLVMRYIVMEDIPEVENLQNDFVHQLRFKRGRKKCGLHQEKGDSQAVKRKRALSVSNDTDLIKFFKFSVAPYHRLREKDTEEIKKNDSADKQQTKNYVTTGSGHSPEDFEFNPKCQFKGNTYAKQKASVEK